MVLASDRGFPGGMLVGGVWSAKGFPSADDLKDNFERVTDSKEAEMLFQEAAAALSASVNRRND